MLLLLMAAMLAKLPGVFTWYVWPHPPLALAGPDAASPPTAASTVTTPAIQRFITLPCPSEKEQCSTSIDIMPEGHRPHNGT
jgi:hypothetical protein